MANDLSEPILTTRVSKAKRDWVRGRKKKSGLSTLAELIFVYDGKIRQITGNAMDLLSFKSNGKICFAGRYLMMRTDSLFGPGAMISFLDSIIHGFCPELEGCIIDSPDARPTHDWFTRLSK